MAIVDSLGREPLFLTLQGGNGNPTQLQNAFRYKVNGKEWEVTLSQLYYAKTPISIKTPLLEEWFYLQRNPKILMQMHRVLSWLVGKRFLNLKVYGWMWPFSFCWTWTWRHFTAYVQWRLLCNQSQHFIPLLLLRCCFPVGQFRLQERLTGI